MPTFRIDVLKGMDSSVVRGMADHPYRLENVVHTRNGGYKPAPTGMLMLENVRAFKQFSYPRYAYVRMDNNSTALYDIQTGQVTQYGSQGYRDLAVYGDQIVTSGSVLGNAPVNFGLGLQSLSVPTQGDIIPPQDRIFSEVPTRAFDLKMGSTEVIPDIRMTAECVPETGYTVAPTDAYSNYVLPGGRKGFTTGIPYVMTVYFARTSRALGTIINPGSASAPYLAPMFVLWIPAEPRDANGTPILGEYTLRLRFTGVPTGYEAQFYGTQQTVSLSAPRARMQASLQVAGVGDTAVSINDTVASYMNMGGYAVWIALSAGTLKGALNPPSTREWKPGDTYRQDGVDFQLLGYSEDNDYYQSSATLNDATLYYHLLQRGGTGAPLYLMAEYSNRANPTVTGNSLKAFYWGRFDAEKQTDDSYVVRRYHPEPRESSPDLATFFPMGTRAVSSGGRVWVAADYVITTALATSRVQDRHSVVPLNYVQREYANNARGASIRTLYYSEPNQPLDFRENFIIPPMRKSYTITALAATSSGVIAFGNADACLISGDSPANFRATALDIPGTLSQATVGSYKGSVVYANEEGLYLLDGGTPTLVSEPVTREWGTPLALSVNALEGTILVSFGDKPSLHFDIRRKDWSVWNMHQLLLGSLGHALPVEQDYHVAAVPKSSGRADVFGLTGEGSAHALARFSLDAGSPETRKHFLKVSYRRDGAQPVELEVAGQGVSSTKQDNESTLMMHRINHHGNSVDLTFRFGFQAVIGGPIVVEAKGVKEATDIREG